MQMDQHKIHNSTTLIKSYKLVSLFATKVFTETVVRSVSNHLIYTGEKMLTLDVVKLSLGLFCVIYKNYCLYIFVIVTNNSIVRCNFKE